MTNGTKIKVLRYVKSDKVVVLKVPRSAQNCGQTCKNVDLQGPKAQVSDKLWRAVCVWLL